MFEINHVEQSYKACKELPCLVPKMIKVVFHTFSCTLYANPNYFNYLTFSPFQTIVHVDSIIDKLDVLDMLNTFMEVTKYVDISRDRHTNPTPKVIVDIKLKIFINNSSLILHPAPKLTHQEFTRQVIQILVEQPSHDDMVVCHLIEIMNDYNHDIWKDQIFELFLMAMVVQMNNIQTYQNWKFTWLMPCNYF